MSNLGTGTKPLQKFLLYYIISFRHKGQLLDFVGI